MAGSGSTRSVVVLAWMCIMLILLVAVFVALIQHVPPSPPPGNNATLVSECDWCDDLRDRLSSMSSELSNGKAREAHACTHLKARDFDDGTYIVNTADTCYVLDEDVVFNPAEAHDFRATREPYASDPAFVLDFPMAIFVRAPGVTIDLGGHEIRQSRAHNVQQRFFAVIELTTPFIAGQGPADFVQGTTPTGAARFVLRNGRLGLSSHHGVHGNGAWSVLIEDVDIVDYDVGAIALNGMHDVHLRKVRALGTSKTVPVLGTYSSARFLMPFVQKALAAASASPEKTRLANAAATLSALMGQVLADVKATGRINKANHAAAYALFGIPSGIPDGSASYGILLHAHGVAVNGFECDRSDARHDKLHHILIEDCDILNTRLDAVEVPVLQEVATSKLQRGPAGDVLRVADLVDTNNGKGYAGTALSDVKIALQEVVNTLASSDGFGTLAAHPMVVAWAAGDVNALATAVSGGAFRYMRNGDNMFHVNKGAFGIRVGGGHHIAIVRTTVNGVVNVGAPANMDPLPGESADDAYWTGGHDGGHPAADPQHGYGGADAVGIAVAASSNVLIDATTIRNVHARAGWSTGVYVFNDAAYTHLHDTGIFNITAHPNVALKITGPKQPRAVGVAVTTDAHKPTYSGSFDVDEVKVGRIGMACNTLVENTGIDGCAPPETNCYSL